MSWLKRGYDCEDALPLDVVGVSPEDAANLNGRITDVPCPTCDKNLVIRIRNKGKVPFLSCGDRECGGEPIWAWGYLGDMTPAGDPTQSHDDEVSFWDDWSYE